MDETPHADSGPFSAKGCRGVSRNAATSHKTTGREVLQKAADPENWRQADAEQQADFRHFTAAEIRRKHEQGVLSCEERWLWFWPEAKEPGWIR